MRTCSAHGIGRDVEGGEVFVVVHDELRDAVAFSGQGNGDREW